MAFVFCVVFFFNDTATTEIYTLSLHDALPISGPPCSCSSEGPSGPWSGEESARAGRAGPAGRGPGRRRPHRGRLAADRKSTRLNSSHANISYAVFCLKKKKITDDHDPA